MKLQEMRPECQTEDCKGIALCMLNNKWRCSACVMRYEQNIKKAKEKLFISEEKYFGKDSS